MVYRKNLTSSKQTPYILKAITLELKNSFFVKLFAPYVVKMSIFAC